MVKLCAKVILQSANVGADQGSVDFIDGLVDQMNIGRQMKNEFEANCGFLKWFMALLLVALAAGCGGEQIRI